MDLTLPFGLWSAPKVFSAVADVFQRVILNRDVDYIFHYVDDFIVLGRTIEEYQHSLVMLEDSWQLGASDGAK